MVARIVVAAFLLTHVVCCSQVSRETRWPELPLLVVPENDEFLMARRQDPKLQPIEKVILIPEVAGYLRGSKRHRIAVADPVVVQCAEEVPVSAILSKLEKNGQRVRMCIMLSRGYAPTGLGPVFNPTCMRDGKEFLLQDMLRLSDVESGEIARMVIKELERGEIRIADRAASVRDAASSGAILGVTFLESPIAKHGKSFYGYTVLWSGPIEDGDKVPVFISPDGIRTIQENLGVTEDKPLPWPRLPLQVIEETARVVPPICDDFTPLEVDKVVLLPQVANYVWRGVKHGLAIADPVVVRPGVTPIGAALSSLKAGDQHVRRCIILTRRLCPGGLFPIFNSVGKREETSSILVDLPVLSEADSDRVGKGIIKQLEEGEITVRGPAMFEDAIHSDSLLGNCWIESRATKKTSRNTLPRSTRIALWDAYLEGQKIPVCLSSDGMKVIRDVLGVESANEPSRQ